MKTILSLIIALVALSASAAVTNITVKVTTEIAGIANGTNSTTLKFQQVDGSAKDSLTVDALSWYYAYAKTSGLYTNSFDEWLKDTAKAAFQQHNAAKSANDLGAAVDKVANAARTDTSLLTTSQKNQILAIAASLP